MEQKLHPKGFGLCAIVTLDVIWKVQKAMLVRARTKESLFTANT